MDPNTMLLLVGGGLGLLLLAKLGYLKPRGPSAPGVAPLPTPAAAPPAQVLTIRHEQAPAPAPPTLSSDGPVHETSISVPMTIRVIPQPPIAPKPPQ